MVDVDCQRRRGGKGKENLALLIELKLVFRLIYFAGSVVEALFHVYFMLRSNVLAAIVHTYVRLELILVLRFRSENLSF